MTALRRLALLASIALAASPGLCPLRGHASPLVGVSLDRLGSVESELPLLRLLEVTAVRAPLRWCDFEPSPGRHRFAAARRAVDAARSIGATPILVLRAISPWGTRHRQRPRKMAGLSTAPLRFDVWGASVGRLAAALAGRGVVYEIEEEPMDPARWWSGAEDYLRLLSAAGAAIKAADPGAVVLAGAAPCGVARDLASQRDRFEWLRRHYKIAKHMTGAWRVFRRGDPASFVPPLPVPSPARIARLLRPRFPREWSLAAHDAWIAAALATGVCDGLAVHNHYFPGENEVDGVEFAAYLAHVVAVMRETGFDLPVWVTATGYVALPAAVDGRVDPGSQDLQEEWGRVAGVQALAMGARAVIWSSLRDGSEPYFGRMGLLDSAGERQPMFETLRHLARHAARLSAPAD